MLKKWLDIIDGVTVKNENGKVVVSGEKGSLERTFTHPKLSLRIEDGKVFIDVKESKRNINAIAGTWKALIKNMMLGVKYGWQAKLKAVHSHFPMKMKVEGNKFILENFLGERNKRSVEIYPDVKIEIKGNEVIVSGGDKEKVGQMAANIEQMTRVKGFDKRVFQDGIYIVEKTHLIGE